jgi:hypothetical protein
MPSYSVILPAITMMFYNAFFFCPALIKLGLRVVHVVDLTHLVAVHDFSNATIIAVMYPPLKGKL